MFTAALDTSVLWPSLQRDFLLSLAIEGTFRPVWSSAILKELEYHEALKLMSRQQISRDEAKQRASHLIQQMRRAFSDSEIHGWEPLDGNYGLPDPDDEHVVASEVLAGAGVIVTANLKDFPAARLPSSLQAIDAPEFASATVSLAPLTALVAVQGMSDRSGRRGPERSVSDLLELLESRYQMHEAVDLIREVRATSPGT